MSRVVVVYPIPSSTSQRIIFALNQQKWEFDTNSYNPMMTNGQISTEEAAQFLQAVAEPLKEWRNKQFLLKYPWAIIILVILLPLLYIFLIYQCCTSCSKQRQYNEALDRSRAIVKENSAVFESRGFTWVTPIAYPRWSELWVGQQQPMMQPGYNNAVVLNQNGYPMGMNQQGFGMNNNLMPNQQGNYNQYGNGQFNNQQTQYGNNMYANKP
jgi:hypothetical protein